MMMANVEKDHKKYSHWHRESCLLILEDGIALCFVLNEAHAAMLTTHSHSINNCGILYGDRKVMNLSGSDD